MASRPAETASDCSWDRLELEDFGEEIGVPVEVAISAGIKPFFCRSSVCTDRAVPFDL